MIQAEKENGNYVMPFLNHSSLDTSNPQNISHKQQNQLVLNNVEVSNPSGISI